MLNYLVLEYLIHITELHCKWLKVNCITITVLSLKWKCQKKKKSNRKVLKFHFLKKERKYQKQKDFKTSQAWVLFFGVFFPGEDFFSCAFFQCEQAGSLPGLYSAVVFWTTSIWSSAYACCVYPNRSDFCQIFPASSSLFILYFVFSVRIS